ncbi:uncharacterized protein Z518_04576 [Rhinocladiella mackenziei CBS 650.93]|uniref:Zn(2)-C6 fungal-type domain-containing protein n=1 Tax=Rhinocladiella mackenziei CBS 650.93 TaxID=1442369 RepID=A0A0D2JBX6_9EURO|nr:uncharacterized protein Z518_04576 [Rhinocladiella mackenziei CBS 650.93]KIX06600.1 hypothetical protein Z518_04576 [Rhinocladiella mackenziei CBS 650.93]
MPACEDCHRRKTKCDRQRPRCSSCLRRSTPCFYPEKSHYRQLRERHLQTLEQRLRTLEHENRNLRLRQINNNVSGMLSLESPEREGEGEDGVDQTCRSDTQLDAHTQDSTTSINETDSPVPATPMDAASSASPHNHLPKTKPNSIYLGSSAGVDFIDIVENVLGSTDPSGPMFANVTNAYRKPGTSTPVKVFASDIPEKAIAVQMVAAYFAHWHITFPLIYRPSFSSLVDRIYDDPDFYRQNPAGAFVFDIVLALGSAASKRFEWSFKDTESHFRRATSALDVILKYRDIRTVQAYLLCCQYGIHASLRDTGEEMWELLGKAGRLCIELGLHRSASSQRFARLDIHLTGRIPEEVQLEMRSRCFWCFYSLERYVMCSPALPGRGFPTDPLFCRIVSVTLGRPLVPSDDDIDAPLPSSYDDDYLLPSSREPGWNWGTNTAPTTSPFLLLVQLRRILSRTHRFLHTSITSRDLPLHDKQEIRKELLMELRQWKSQIPQLLDLQKRTEQSSTLSAFTFQSWYEALYHTTVLLLYRPSSTFPSRGPQTSLLEDNVPKVIWESSRATIAKYKDILQARRLNYSWVCLYTIFMAGLANIYSVARCAQMHKSDPISNSSFLPPLVEAVADIRDCSNILIAICERWDDARSSCEIFSRLSNSAIGELYKAHLQNSRPEQTNGNLNSINPTATTTAATSTRDTSSQAAGPILPGVSPLAQAQLEMIPDIMDTTKQTTENVDDFRLFFQDLQTDVHGNGCDGANEVLLGLDMEWFEQLQ